MDAETNKPLEELRISLLRLHKSLLDEERIAFEEKNGAVGNPARLLSLVMSDPWFDWLHVISRLIVRFDEVIEEPGHVNDQTLAAKVALLLHEVHSLVIPGTNENEFTKRYKTILRRNSSAVLHHSSVLKALDLANQTIGKRLNNA